MKINGFSYSNYIQTDLEASQKAGNVKPAIAQNDKVASKKPLSPWNRNDKREFSKGNRWNLARIPLKYCIDCSVKAAKFLPEFVAAAESAFQPWSRASYGLIRFEKTYNADNADIIISWADKVTVGRSFEAGHNNLKVFNSKIEKAEISIVIFPLIDESVSPEARIERVRRTVLHEIGHSLGLEHSNSSKDVMFHRGINNKNLSQNDIRNLCELYKSKTPDIII